METGKGIQEDWDCLFRDPGQPEMEKQKTGDIRPRPVPRLPSHQQDYCVVTVIGDQEPLVRSHSQSECTRKRTTSQSDYKYMLNGRQEKLLRSQSDGEPRGNEEETLLRSQSICLLTQGQRPCPTIGGGKICREPSLQGNYYKSMEEVLERVFSLPSHANTKQDGRDAKNKVCTNSAENTCQSGMESTDDPGMKSIEEPGINETGGRMGIVAIED